MNIAEVDEKMGIALPTYKTYAICGSIRRMVCSLILDQSLKELFCDFPLFPIIDENFHQAWIWQVFII